MKLLLIRHGETTGDIEDRYGGQYDDHLTERGREQLQCTADSLAGRNVDMMYVSTLTRARESAEIIIAVSQAEVELLDGLRERNYGVLGGLTKREALEKYPEAVELHKNPINTDPDGESLEDFTKRVLDTFEYIKAKNNNCVVILAHGGSLKVIMRHLNMPIPDKIGDGEVIEIEL